jgi:hypothetical protein
MLTLPTHHLVKNTDAREICRLFINGGLTVVPGASLASVPECPVSEIPQAEA